MTNLEKEILKLKFGLAVMKKIDENKALAKSNKENGKETNQLIDSLRKLEASSGIPYPSIQKITVGEKNASFTTISALVDGLEISLDEFFANYYYTISDSEVEKKLKLKKSKR
jgi:hypothetical protein